MWLFDLIGECYLAMKRILKANEKRLERSLRRGSGEELTADLKRLATMRPTKMPMAMETQVGSLDKGL